MNLSKLPSRTIELKARGKPYFIGLPELFFDETDFSITCSLPKVYYVNQITHSFKNQWGCLAYTMRLKNPYAFDEVIDQIVG